MDRQVVEVSSLSLSFFLFLWVSTYLPTCLSLSLFLSVSHPITNLSSYVSSYLSIYLSICSITPVMTNCFSEWNLWSRIEKRSNSARLPQFLHLTTSKTKQFCETSYFLKLTTSKTKQFCETSFKNGKLSAELTASYQCVLRFFQSICLNYCACHEKVMPGHTKCCTCLAKSSQQAWESEAPKCNRSQEICARTS